MSDIYYFGCIGQSGHYLFRSEAKRARKTDGRLYHSWMNRLDGVLAPTDLAEKQGPTARHEMHGHTVLSFWDRSVDKRGACNSILFIPGVMSFAEALEKAREAFPEVFGRLKFEITEHVLKVSP